MNAVSPLLAAFLFAGASVASNALAASDPVFQAMLDTGIFPLGLSNPLRAQYIEVFALNVNDFPDVTLHAHNELLAPVGVPRHRIVRH